MNVTLLTVSSALLLSAATSAVADDKFDADRLQQSIDKVVKKVTPATVEVRSLARGGNGTFSAAIVSTEGYVLTAGHAVQPDARYEILLPDGRSFEASGLGTEPHIDMGVIKIDAPDNLPVVEMGWSSSLKENEPCISLGYPGQLDLDRGVVVRFGRIADPVTSQGFIRSTCLMEPGDSGGPLYDLKGRLIGIHSNITESLDSNNEVPVDQFRRYWDHLIVAKEFHDHNLNIGPDFGFAFTETANPHSRKQNTADRLSSVAQVAQGGLASESGLQSGDRILTVDGQNAKFKREANVLLQRAYTLKKPAVVIGVKRNGQELSLSLKLPANYQPYDAWNKGIAISQQEPGVKPIAAQPQLAQLEDQFAEVEQKLDSASFSVTSMNNGEQSEALATLFKPGNILVSKSSRVGTSVAVQREGQSYPAEVVARDKDRDLVLLKIAKRVKGGIKVSDRGSKGVELGTMLLSPHPTTQGLVSVKSTGEFAIEKRDSAGFLGVSPSTVDGKVHLDQVHPDTPAATQLKQGDYLLAVDGEKIVSGQELIEKLRNYGPGDVVRLSAQRDGEGMSLELTLGSKPAAGSGHVAEYFEGGKSLRRDGFDAIFSHDARLRPEQCGGPLFTAEGDFVGINVARYSRTRSYAIPASEVVDFIDSTR